ncbi:MAG: hypothetical protein ACKOAR_03440, partial [Bacteroidota bacterium]
TCKNFFLSFVPVLVLLSCNGDDPAPGVRFGMKAVAMESMIGGRKAHGVVTFQEVKAGVSKVELQTASVQDDPELEAEFKGAFLVDLLAGTSDPDFGLATLTPANYDKVEFNLSPLLSGGKSLFIRFIHDQTQFELSTGQELELEVEGLSGLGLSSASGAKDLLVLIDLDQLFMGITLDTLVPGNDGVVRINDSTNSGVLAQILENFEDSCEAGEDRDRDGEIDD